MQVGTGEYKARVLWMAWLDTFESGRWTYKDSWASWSNRVLGVQWYVDFLDILFKVEDRLLYLVLNTAKKEDTQFG